MKEKGTQPKTFWVTDEILTILDNACKTEGLRNRSDAMRNRVRSGEILIRTLSGVKNNPEALEEAMIQLDDLRKQEKLGVYLESMTKEQRNAVVDIIQLINAGKWQQTNLICYETAQEISI